MADGQKRRMGQETGALIVAFKGHPTLADRDPEHIFLLARKVRDEKGLTAEEFKGLTAKADAERAALEHQFVAEKARQLPPGSLIIGDIHRGEEESSWFAALLEHSYYRALTIFAVLAATLAIYLLTKVL